MIHRRRQLFKAYFSLDVSSAACVSAYELQVIKRIYSIRSVFEVDLQHAERRAGDQSATNSSLALALNTAVECAASLT